MDITLTDSQHKVGNSVRRWYSSVDNQVFYLAGYAGTGKTTIIPNILDMCGINPLDVAFCAPTGKAAQVLTKKLAVFYAERELKARTIHSWIYTPKKMKVEQIAEQIEKIEKEINHRLSNEEGIYPEFEDLSNKRLERLLLLSIDDLNKQDSDGLSFNLNVYSKIAGKHLIVVDESSMVGLSVARDLKQFGIPILAVGDPFQLQPVKDKRGLAVGEPDEFMTEIHRQAKDNPIIALATKIRNGEFVGYGSMGDEVQIIKRRNDNITLDTDRDCQILVGKNVTRFRITSKIRNSLGYIADTPQVDEPLMICKNSRTSPALVNGTPVWCAEAPTELIDKSTTFPMSIVDESGTEYKVKALQKLFENHIGNSMESYSASKQAVINATKRGAEHVDFAWVITGHKSQGSQWDEVVVHDESGVFRNEAMNWLYTCVTRASKRLTIVR